MRREAYEVPGRTARVPHIRDESPRLMARGFALQRVSFHIGAPTAKQPRSPTPYSLLPNSFTIVNPRIIAPPASCSAVTGSASSATETSTATSGSM